MKKIIEEISKNEIVTIYSDDIEEFVQGFVYQINEVDLVLACVDSHGENTGFLLLEFNGIYRVDFGSVYEKKIQCLYEQKKQTHDAVNFSEEDSSLREQLLRWAYRNDKTVTIGFEDCDYEVCGYLQGEKDYKIKMIDKYECRPGQGTSCVVPEKAKYIWVDERRARDAGMVYKWKEQNCYEP